MTGSVGEKRVQSSQPASDMAGILAGEIQRRRRELADKLAAGEVPSVDEINAVNALGEIKSSLPRRSLSKLGRVVLWTLSAVTLAIVAFAFIRVGATEVQLDIRMTGLTLDLQATDKEIQITGENEEVLVLKKADILSPHPNDQPGSVARSRLESLTIPSGVCPSGRSDPPSPSGTPEPVPCRGSTLRLQLAFDLVDPKDDVQSRGVLVGAKSTKPAQARLNWGDFATPVNWTGTDLRVAFYPASESKPLTVARNVRIARAIFGGSNVILGGTVFVRNRPEPTVSLRPGDELLIDPGAPATVRQITLADGELRAIVSYPSATSVLLGDPHPRDLLPTVFDWLRASWPTQLYGAITAIAAAWVTLREWAKKAL